MLSAIFLFLGLCFGAAECQNDQYFLLTKLISIIFFILFYYSMKWREHVFRNCR